jgi:hypothetical protein
LFETNSTPPGPKKLSFLSYIPLNCGNAVADGRATPPERGSCFTLKTDRGENWDWGQPTKKS